MDSTISSCSSGMLSSECAWRQKKFFFDGMSWLSSDFQIDWIEYLFSFGKNILNENLSVPV